MSRAVASPRHPWAGAGRGFSALASLPCSVAGDQPRALPHSPCLSGLTWDSDWERTLEGPESEAGTALAHAVCAVCACSPPAGQSYQGRLSPSLARGLAENRQMPPGRSQTICIAQRERYEPGGQQERAAGAGAGAGVRVGERTAHPRNALGHGVASPRACPLQPQPPPKPLL